MRARAGRGVGAPRGAPTLPLAFVLPVPLALALAVLVVGGLGSTAARGSPRSVGPTDLVPRTAILWGIACPRVDACVAVGDQGGDPRDTAEVVPIANGTPGRATDGATPTQSIFTLRGVDCAGDECVGVGAELPAVDVRPQTDSGLVETITSAGRPLGANFVQDAFLQGVSCWAPDDCEAVGTRGSSGVIVAIATGIPDPGRGAPGTGRLFGIACPGASTCYAVGSDSSGRKGLVQTIAGGKPGAILTAPGLPPLQGITCPSSTFCEAVGSDVVVSIEQGILGTPEPVPGLGLNVVACATLTTCEAGGNASPSGASGGGTSYRLMRILDGQPGATEPVPEGDEVLAIACPSVVWCEAVGATGSPEGFTLSVIPGTPPTTATFFPPGASGKHAPEPTGPRLALTIGLALVLGGAVVWGAWKWLRH